MAVPVRAAGVAVAEAKYCPTVTVLGVVSGTGVGSSFLQAERAIAAAKHRKTNFFM
jgi:hypothetical protein